ncbi:Predicted lipid carrier protein YhbT, contains SCP2 domain [Pseudomonas pohangensis]|jgi:predicted lipid carrier protein YhbT|uniref:Ubiquinone biosynthesis accessory factor UbiT n=1 Tax=Pseudomonas pohangensis TaxID=364197 RepID=A0A1H2I5K4_9PSED|nr:SCP2 sterol-binding domain-containing protein [Pseudomonas pohangensis]SDU39196.1 Predicted lipid carrier protein YhbT, contains SCP2 domain [Pseudomonas pohangensis]
MLSRAALSLKLTERLLPLAARVPQNLQRWPLQQALNRLFAAALREGSFASLEGRWLRLQVRDLDIGWCLSATPTGLQLQASAPAEVTISGNWREFLLLASRQEDPDTLFFRRRLQIEGDTELGLEVKNLLDSLDPDHLPAPLWSALQQMGQTLAARPQAEAAG